MKEIKYRSELTQELDKLRSEGKSIGFVPTMGGLHEGHLSLIRRCKSENDLTVVSLFLNPTQFNDPKDLETYPHNTAEDLEALEREGVDIVFVPSPKDMYDQGEQPPHYNLGRVVEVMEGKHRPGHFEGVVWVVSKLFKLVHPDKAYFGEKDYQQIAVIRKMVQEDPQMDVEIISCPVIREDDGLAMSSRNRRLNEEERAAAPRIYEGLQRGVEWSSAHTVPEVESMVVYYIEENPLLRVEYFEIVEGNTLERVEAWNEAKSIVGCITVYCGEVRLIDHIRFRPYQLTSSEA